MAMKQDLIFKQELLTLTRPLVDFLLVLCNCKILYTNKKSLDSVTDAYLP